MARLSLLFLMAPYYRNVTRGWYHEYHGLSEYEMGVLCWRSRDDIHIHQTLTGVKCKQASRESEQPPSRPSPKYGNLLCTMGWDTQGGGAQISSFLLFFRDWSRELFKNWRRSQQSTNTHQSPTGGDLIKSVLFLAKKVKSKIRIQFPRRFFNISTKQYCTRYARLCKAKYIVQTIYCTIFFILTVCNKVFYIFQILQTV